MSFGMFQAALRITVVACVLLGLAPAQAQVFHPTTFSLDNGMQVVVVENRRAPVAIAHRLVPGRCCRRADRASPASRISSST
jgi:hypothetical protein